jgi:RNase H-fold protein (predicted Holliday junction resolvase)
MTDDDIAALINDTAGQHWGDEAHFQRFAVALEKRFELDSMPAIKLVMQAERQNVVAAERQRCAQIAREFDRDHPNTNYGGFIARLIEEQP